MTLGLSLYRLFTRFVSLFLGSVLSRRVRSGKEDATRLNERRAKSLPMRPSGRIVWLHGASVGESLILLELGKRLQAEAPDIHLLFTSQTRTSAELVARNLPPRSIHQMAPIDTLGNAKRFMRHWQPALGIIAEGDVWPNLIRRAKKHGTRLALVNARMTDKSLQGWKKWQRTAQQTLGSFDVILAADASTAKGLETILDRPVETPGNLKSALPPPASDETEHRRMVEKFIGSRGCLLAASTHPEEEILVATALEQISPRPALIIAPRHPERGEEIQSELAGRGLTVSRRSLNEPISTSTDVLLADTLGEMGLWYRLANTIYLGGGHAEGVGGHNPLEPLKLGKSVITGPDVFNFADIMQTLSAIGAVQFAADADELARLTTAPHEIDQGALNNWLSKSDAPMQTTLSALLPLLEARA